ncbi:hypothetical protein [Nocardia tengchongensis]|uniref:hypothetical protein n=1 Tax=Nocardia tengchongensis TaxID=2055889 RepID=UPI00360EF242
MKNPEIIDSVAALVASLPRQHREAIPARALVVLLVNNAKHAWEPMPVHGVYVAELDTCGGCCTVEGDYWGWINTGNTIAVSAVAVVVDDEADGPGDSGTEHAKLIDRLGLDMHEQGIPLEAAYAARATEPGHPVWSLDTEEFIAAVPATAEPGPDHDGYALAADVVTRPWPPIARLA